MKKNIHFVLMNFVKIENEIELSSDEEEDQEEGEISLVNIFIPV